MTNKTNVDLCSFVHRFTKSGSNKLRLTLTVTSVSFDRFKIYYTENTPTATAVAVDTDLLQNLSCVYHIKLQFLLSSSLKSLLFLLPFLFNTHIKIFLE